MNPIKYQQFILKSTDHEKTFLRHLVNNYSQFDIYYTDDGCFRLERGGFNIDFYIHQSQNQIFIDLDVSKELSNRYQEYIAYDQPNKYVFIYPVTKSFDFTTLRFDFADENHKKIFYNILELIIKQQMDLEEAFYKDIIKERRKNILSILTSSAIVTGSFFVLLLDFLEENNLDNFYFILFSHLIIFASWKFIDEKIYFYNKN